MPHSREKLAVGLADNSIEIWDCERGVKIRSLGGHEGRVTSLSWNPKEVGVLSSGSRDCKIINHDIRMANDNIVLFEGHRQEVCGLKWSPDGSQLASGANDNNLFIWDPTMNVSKY